MFFWIPVRLEQPAPVQIANERDQRTRRSAAFGQRRGIGNGKQQCRNLCAGNVAVIESVGDCPQSVEFRRHVDGDSKIRTDLVGNLPAISWFPKRLSEDLDTLQEWRLVHARTVRVAGDPDAPGRWRQSKFAGQAGSF